MSLTLVPTTLAEACAFVQEHHRHHSAPPGHLFSVAVADEHATVDGVGSVWARDWHVGGVPVAQIDPKGGDPQHWPEGLNVREWPATLRAVLS